MEQNERKLCGRYIVNVYSDGSIETSRIPIENDTELEKHIDVSELSDSVSQVLLVMKDYMRIYKAYKDESEESGNDFDIDYDDVVRASLKRIAKLLDVNLMTVTSKVTKNLFDEDMEYLTLPEFYEMANLYAYEYYSNNDYQNVKNTDFYKCLIRSLPKRNKSNNSKAIELFTKDPTIPFLLKDGSSF